MSKDELVSKFTAIQYGLVIAGVILLIVYTYNTYKDYISTLLGCAPQGPVSEFLNVKQRAAVPQSTSLRPPSSQTFASKFKAAIGDIGGGQESYTSDRLAQMDEGAWDPAQLSLEQSVYDSHREFTDDAYVSTQGPNNKNIVRDDTNEVNVRVGLRRVDYVTTSSEEDARTVSSEYPDQVEQPNQGTFTL